VQDKSAGGGHLFLNGVQQSDNVVFGNTETGRRIRQSSQCSFAAGAAGAVDSIGFSPIDSHQAFSNATASVTSQSTNNPPTATAHNQNVARGTSIALTTPYTFSYPDAGDSVTGFAVQDKSAGGGHLYLNGVQQSDYVVFGPPAPGPPLFPYTTLFRSAGAAGAVDSIGFSPIDSHQAFSNATASDTSQSTNNPPLVSS